MKVYLSNKMSGVPYFNAPWFDATTEHLRAYPGVTEVFNPAEEDRKHGFEPLDCPNGTMEEAIAAGFVAEQALGADWAWIAHHADCVVVGDRWIDSPGAISEMACAQALRKPVYEEDIFFSYMGTDVLQHFQLPPIMAIGRPKLPLPGVPWRPWEREPWRLS